MAMTNPRSSCVKALIEWEATRRQADAVLHEVLVRGNHSMVDRAFFNEMFYGVIRNLRMLDWVIAQLREENISLQTRQVLRLGLYQIFKMRVPDHATVNETVSLAGRARPLVNAVLRRAIRERKSLESALAKAAPAIRLSHPEFLFARWEKHFGRRDAIWLCEWDNSPATMYVRANMLKITAGELHRATPDAEPMPFHPLALRVEQVPFLWIANGLCYVQDPSTLVACDLLAPQPGEDVLDACAAPGGKTTYLAQLMADQGTIVACDSSALRLARLTENVDRLGVTNTIIEQEDWIAPGGMASQRTYDAILLDAPCTNTGVLRRRADARWRLTSEDYLKMQNIQITMLANLAPLLNPGGRLVYSTCSIEPEENEEVVRLARERIPELEFVEARQSLPFRDAVDGAFAAKFLRKPSD
jgi:16S rRNA (cytosine967-C5)-methyltransferase